MGKRSDRVFVLFCWLFLDVNLVMFKIMEMRMYGFTVGLYMCRSVCFLFNAPFLCFAIL